MTSLEAIRCTECQTEIAPGLLSCPSCARMVHADELRELARRADEAQRNSNWTEALTAWRQAVQYLPPGTRQRDLAEARIRDLSARVDSGADRKSDPWWKRASALGPVGVVAAILGKAKFLLLGFTKFGTLLSFAAGLSVYWALWGWKFALCFLLSIYVHEMGHVAALHRYGIAASAPTFIPGLGAFVRLKQHPATEKEDARVGLAGPVWGLFASLFALALYAATGNPLFAAVARAGAWLNLFNLIPVWQLDGSRGIRSLNRAQIWLLALLAAAMWMFVEDGMLALAALLLAFRAATKRESPEPDWRGMIQFAGLIVTLSLLCLIPLPAKP
ncbi:MAG TPA: site-2 protease family protein [Bryobacteraceae bacterium]|nr:site-2 protease family protein [Bryobacteraceae bacterium]